MKILLRAVVMLGLVGLGGWGTFEARRMFSGHETQLAERDQRIAALQQDVLDRGERIDRLEREVLRRNERIDELVREVAERDDRIAEQAMALQLLKIDHRVARLEVLSQEPAEEGAGVEVRTRVRFQEVDGAGVPLGPSRVVTIDGRRAYVEALVVKFDDDFVEGGDAWRGTSICLFRRLFGESQSPEAGTELDAVGARPAIYSSDDAHPEFQRRIWERFWDYANDPALAREAGVRAVHGEAPFIELREGGAYRVELRASGGLAIRREP